LLNVHSLTLLIAYPTVAAAIHHSWSPVFTLVT